MQQQRLFRLAPESLYVSAVFEPSSGWRLKVAVRRQDESWSEAGQSVYSHMTTLELTDVICSEVCGRLLDL